MLDTYAADVLRILCLVQSKIRKPEVKPGYKPPVFYFPYRNGVHVMWAGEDADAWHYELNRWLEVNAGAVPGDRYACLSVGDAGWLGRQIHRLWQRKANAI